MIAKQKILIVDDKSETIDMLNTILLESGYSTFVALNGKLALEIAHKVIPDLILLNILLPEMDGYETCQHLKDNKITKNIPIIFLLEFAKTTDKAKVYQAGGVDYVSKPIESEELLARINTHLTISRLQNKLKETNQKLEKTNQNSEKTIKKQTADPVIVNEGILIATEYNNKEKEKIQLPHSEPYDIKGKQKDGTIISNNITFKNDDFRIAAIQDIRIKKELDKQLLNSIIETEEKERSNFARELHDGLGPVLSTLKMFIEWLSDSNRGGNRPEILTKSLKTVNEAIINLKEISNNISPHILSQYGLISALNSYINKISEIVNTKIQFENNLDERLPKNIEITLYRILIESINNTRKYASASNISINIKKEKTAISVIYSDDGTGFDVNAIIKKKKGMGLFNMQNRIEIIGGTIEILSAANKGVVIKIKISNGHKI